MKLPGSRMVLSSAAIAAARSTRYGRRSSRLLVLGMALWASACVPMTFSNEATIDFDRYRSVRVEVGASLWMVRYLAGELEENSGFEFITTELGPTVDLVLKVEVNVREDVTVDANGDTDTEYHSHARFTASEPSGNIVVDGECEDDSYSSTEAAEDALDEVALEFLPSYHL